VQIILKRSSREEQSVLGIIESNNLGEDGLLVFDTMSFVDDDVTPSKLSESG
jgi:hypothetical protein